MSRVIISFVQCLDTVDVYIDKKNRIWIVDFNPFGAPTSSLMFSWEELIDSERDSTGSILKVVESEAEVLADASGSYRGPVDVHLSPNFPNFLEICKQQAQEEDN